MSLEKKYMVVHCTGYLKSWAPAKIGMHDQDGEGDVDACNLSCLVSPLQFMHQCTSFNRENLIIQISLNVFLMQKQ